MPARQIKGMANDSWCYAIERGSDMKTVLAYGDSNTWGMVPGSKSGERYPWEIRWTGILQEKCPSVRIIEEGLCGRTTAFEDDLRPGRKGVAALPMILDSHHPLDGAILMLGTNDCKSIYSVSAETIGKGIQLCLDKMERYVPVQNILLVSPILLQEDVWLPEKDPEFSRQSVVTCHRLKEVYSAIARQRQTSFLAASDYVLANDADGEHMDEEGHRVFAMAVYGKIKELGMI